MNGIGNLISTALGWLSGKSKDHPTATAWGGFAVVVTQLLGFAPGSVKSTLLSAAEVLTTIAGAFPG